MTITYRFTYRGIEIEVEGDRQKDDAEIIGHALDTIDNLSEERDLTDLQADYQPAPTASSNPEKSGGSLLPVTEADVPQEIADYAQRCGVSPEELASIIDFNLEGDEPPFVLVDPDELGSSRRERQLNASLLILGVWTECYSGTEDDWMEVSVLKDGLQYSSVDPERLYSMYNMKKADTYFHRRGRGGNAQIKLTRPGIREARGYVQTLIQEMDEQETSSE